MDQGGLMKLLNQFNILPKYLTAFNYAGLNLNETLMSFSLMHNQERSTRISLQEFHLRSNKP